jgi:hypothetical protein
MRQISNQQSVLIQLLYGGTCFVMAVTFGILLFDNFSMIGQRILCTGVFLAAGLGFYISMKFCKVSFDNDFIYISGFRFKRQLPIEHILEIKPGIFPMRFFYGTIYAVTVKYIDDGVQKKIKFFSKRVPGMAGTRDKIPFLDMLAELVREKKYRRGTAIS